MVTVKSYVIQAKVYAKFPPSYNFKIGPRPLSTDGSRSPLYDQIPGVVCSVSLPMTADRKTNFSNGEVILTSV